MPREGSIILPVLLVQLARMGDLLQSFPAFFGIQSRGKGQSVDVLCPSPLVPLAQLFPRINNVFPWDGDAWQKLVLPEGNFSKPILAKVNNFLVEQNFPLYSLAYNLNNHPRSILASHLLCDRVMGAGEQGALNPSLPPWVAYLRQVAWDRGTNRIHLADAFCGVCGVKPPVAVPCIQADHVDLLPDLAQMVNDGSLRRIGIVLGAGDADRRVPLAAWRCLIEACVEHLPNCLVLLIGGSGEREAALALEDQLSPHSLSRTFNCVGRTTLPQLANVFNRCQWVIGSDTGPLHLAVACGARAVGWYFSRARVHETGPYGVGHYVWQHQKSVISKQMEAQGLGKNLGFPGSWPVMETIQLMLDERVDESLPDWKLWTSHRDEWGVFYTYGGKPDDAVLLRKETWKRLSDVASQQQACVISGDMITG